MDYYIENKFEFRKDALHEDFGLIPLVIIKSKKVNSINYLGYNYLQRQGSIMSNKNYEKTKKKVDDMYLHYNYLIEEANKLDVDTTIFKSFVANSLILKITELNHRDYKVYLNKLKQEKVFDNLLTDTTGRKVKKVLLTVSPIIYLKLKG